MDVSELADGDLTIDAEATDNNGNGLTAQTTAALDAVDGDLTVDARANDSDAVLDINGTSEDVADGDTVNLTITDQNGDTVTTSTTVDSNGDYGVIGLDVSELTDGDLTIDAEATDNNGNPVTAQDTAVLDAVSPGEPLYDGVYLIDQNEFSNKTDPEDLAIEENLISANDDGYYEIDNPQVLMFDLGQEVEAFHALIDEETGWSNNSSWAVYDSDGNRIGDDDGTFPEDGVFQVLDEDGSPDSFQYIMFNSSGSAEFGIKPTGVTLVADEAGGELVGTVGDDVLIGGAGDDVLIGGDGDDVFLWNSGDEGSVDEPANDVVMDFGDGDNVLDVSDLLDGASEPDVADFIIAEEDGDDTVLYINSEGTLGGDTENADQTIRLEGKSFSDLGGSNSEDVINQLLNNDQLKIDQ